MSQGGSVLALSTSIVHAERRQMFLPQHSGWQGARFAHGGYRSRWWQADPTAEAPVSFLAWQVFVQCLLSLVTVTFRKYWFGIKKNKKRFPVLQFCTCSLLLFHILKKNELRLQCSPISSRSTWNVIYQCLTSFRFERLILGEWSAQDKQRLRGDHMSVHVYPSRLGKAVVKQNHTRLFQYLFHVIWKCQY